MVKEGRLALRTCEALLCGAFTHALDASVEIGVRGEKLIQL